jgi:biotin carboxyl carrier protein
VVIDGTPREVDTALLERSAYSLLVGGKSYDVTVHDLGRETFVVRHGGFARRVRLVNPLITAASAHAAPAGPMTVRAIMAGRVVKLLVTEGDEVQEGQPVVVLEAMKMENDIPAPKSGRVGVIHVSAGQTVENDERLLVVG